MDTPGARPTNTASSRGALRLARSARGLKDTLFQGL